ncbi:hypothetical protein BH24ACT20_BH24ACT20_07080 [soil metagenome]
MGKPLMVLVVEDSEDDTLLLLRELRRGGYEPTHERVQSAREMKEALARDSWDLVVSDHSMPTFSSLSALELLRESGFTDLPFVIVSGQIGEDAAVEAMKAGAQDYIMKDNLTRLTSAISRELSEAEVRRSRRRAERALQESEERFRSLVQYASDIIVVLDAEGVIRYESPAVERVLGYKPEERIGKSAFDLLHPDDAEKVKEVLQEYLGKPGSKPPRIEYRVRAQDGTLRYFEAISTNLLHDPSVGGIVVNARDVTERKQAEEEIRRAEEKYRGIFENAVEGIYQVTVEGRMLTANPAMARILGYESPEDLTGSVTDVTEQLYVDPGDREEFQRLMMLGGAVNGFETEMYRKDGRIVAVSFAARVLRDPSTGEHVGYEGIMEDISERRRNEEALREMREGERRRIARDLHDVVLQDLTYSLQSMQASRFLERNEKEDAGRRDQEIEALRKAVGGLREAIYDLRLDSFQEQSLLRSVKSLVELNRRMSSEWEVNLLAEEDLPDLPGVVKVEVFRVLQEALVNVRRHSGARRVEVILGAEGEYVRVEVRDDGCGFDPEESSGMGITGMIERAKAIDGEFEVRSEPGKGTEIRLRVPTSSPGA